MTQCYIAYFDFLGFKEFILNNDNEHLELRMGHILRDIEIAQSLGLMQKLKGARIFADLSNSIINSLNISDTVIFWTNDNSPRSFNELLQVAYEFNWRVNRLNTPARGCISYGSLKIIEHEQSTSNKGSYNVKCLYGKGIVFAHLKAENQSWAGCVVDQSAIDEVSKNIDPTLILEKYSKKYLIPYKNASENQTEEYALKIIDSLLAPFAYINIKEMIENTFSVDNKSISSKRVQEILANTIKFLDTFKE